MNKDQILELNIYVDINLLQELGIAIRDATKVMTFILSISN